MIISSSADYSNGDGPNLDAINEDKLRVIPESRKIGLLQWLSRCFGRYFCRSYGVEKRIHEEESAEPRIPEQQPGDFGTAPNVASPHVNETPCAAHEEQIVVMDEPNSEATETSQEIHNYEVCSYRLRGGKTVKIVIDADPKLFDVGEIRDIDNLVDFNVTVERESEALEVDGQLQIESTIEIEGFDRIVMPHWSASGACIRLGPLLAQITEGSTQICSRHVFRTDEKADLDVHIILRRITRNRDSAPRLNALVSDLWSFLNSAGSRGLDLDGEKLLICEELALLCSPYFEALFSNRYSDSKREWIKISEVEGTSLLRGIHLSLVLRRHRTLYKSELSKCAMMNSGASNLADIGIVMDRFLMPNMHDFVRHKIKTTNQWDDWLLHLVDLLSELGDAKIIEDLALRLAMPECIEYLLAEKKMSPKIRLALQQRLEDVKEKTQSCRGVAEIRIKNLGMRDVRLLEDYHYMLYFRIREEERFVSVVTTIAALDPIAHTPLFVLDYHFQLCEPIDSTGRAFNMAILSYGTTIREPQVVTGIILTPAQSKLNDLNPSQFRPLNLFSRRRTLNIPSSSSSSSSSENEM